MPIFSLAREEDQRELANQPETGMGFQILEVSISEYNVNLYVAFVKAFGFSAKRDFHL